MGNVRPFVLLSVVDPKNKSIKLKCTRSKGTSRSQLCASFFYKGTRENISLNIIEINSLSMSMSMGHGNRGNDEYEKVM